MTIVIRESCYTCIDPDAAARFALSLTNVDELRGVTVDGSIVTVPGMDLVGAIEIAELGVTRGCMTDTDAAAFIAGINRDGLAHVDRSPVVAVDQPAPRRRRGRR